MADATILSEHDKPHIYRYRRVNNLHFQLPHRVDKGAHSILHDTFENDLRAVHALGLEGMLFLVPENTEGRLKGEVIPQLPDLKYQLCAKLPPSDDEEGRLDEVCKALSASNRCKLDLRV